MRKGKQHERRGKDASAPLQKPKSSDRGALSSGPDQGATRTLLQDDTDQEVLPFRVDLPSRRWLELATGKK